MNHTFVSLLVLSRPEGQDGEGSVAPVGEVGLQLELRALSWVGPSGLQDSGL